MLSEGLLEFVVEVFSDVWLRCGVLVDPETYLVRKLLVVEPGWQHSLLDKLQLHLLSPLVRLEVAVNHLLRDLLGEVSGGRSSLEENLGDPLFELGVRDFVQSNIDFIEETALEVEVAGLSQHLQRQLHR